MMVSSPPFGPGLDEGDGEEKQGKRNQIERVVEAGGQDVEDEGGQLATRREKSLLMRRVSWAGDCTTSK